MINPTFITIGESKYFEVMKLNVVNIRRLYPQSRIGVYDYGLTQEQCDWLVENGRVYIEPLSRHEINPVLFAMCFKPVAMAWNNDSPIIWVDADMVLLDRIDEVLNIDRDIIVTVRDTDKPNFRINSGLVVVNNMDILFSWIAYNLTEILAGNTGRGAEQEALNKLVYREGYDYLEVPCDVYNYTRVEDGIPKGTKAVHLKKSRYKNAKLIETVRSYET